MSSLEHGRRMYLTISEASTGWPLVRLLHFQGFAVWEARPDEYRKFVEM